MRLSKIAKEIGVDYRGDDIEIDSIKTLKEANSNSLSFFHLSKYLDDLKNTKAAAVIIDKKNVKYLPKESRALICDEPYVKLALATKLFAHKISAKEYDPIIKGEAQISKGAFFGKNVIVEDGAIIMAGAYIGDNVIIGKDSIIYPNVTIYHNCLIGNRVTIHSGAVIGSDGFGFATSKSHEIIKIYQLGRVVIEDDVEIGANSTIDRGAIGDTIIKRGVKIDNLVQIGHNCEIGEGSIIVSQVGLSGSTILGRGVVMGGQSATAGHLKIGDFAKIAARGGVTKSLEGNRIYGGFPAVDIKEWRREIATIKKLAKSDKLR